MCMCCLDVGLATPGRALHYVTASVLLRLGFFGLLRPGELLKLRFGDIRLFSHGNRTMAVIAIPNPKNWRAFGMSQFSVVR